MEVQCSLADGPIDQDTGDGQFDQEGGVVFYFAGIGRHCIHHSHRTGGCGCAMGGGLGLFEIEWPGIGELAMDNMGDAVANLLV